MAVSQDPESAFHNQILYCLADNAPVTAQANKSIWKAADETTEFGRRLRSWPSGGEPALLAVAHPHGAWIDWKT